MTGANRFEAEIVARSAELASWTGRRLTFMEVCGTHTMAIARSGLRGLLPATIRLISGPGCPVCVSPTSYIDHALAIAEQTDAIVATFGDLMRVPGSAARASDPARTLLRQRASGGDVRVVYSPRDALALARDHGERQVVFLSVGFETTAPTIAAALIEAREQGLTNFSILGANRTIPAAMSTLASAEDLALDGFLCPGHVSIIIGPEPYAPLAAQHGLACAIAGFEPVEILRGLCALLQQISSEAPGVDNCYQPAVRAGGNPRARAVLDQVFRPADADWRGIGNIAGSGLSLAEDFSAFDAATRFDLEVPSSAAPTACRCGEVLRGVLDPRDCSLFAKRCTPDNPVGACMVSSEGTCAASYHYGNDSIEQQGASR